MRPPRVRQLDGRIRPPVEREPHRPAEDRRQADEPASTRSPNVSAKTSAFPRPAERPRMMRPRWRELAARGARAQAKNPQNRPHLICSLIR